MAVPYSYGNPYATGSQIFHAPDGSTYLSEDDMYRAQQWKEQQRARADADRFKFDRAMGNASYGGGGGVPRGTGGGGGMGGMGSLADSYANAYNTARGANESRYNDIMGGYNKLLGGGSQPAKQSTRTIRSIGSMAGGNYQNYRSSGSPLGYFEWLNLMRQGERTAMQRGGAFGSMDASRLYPRMWGEGEFLGNPSQGGGSGAAAMQRPTVVQPTYAQYTPPARGNQNY